MFRPQPVPWRKSIDHHAQQKDTAQIAEQLTALSKKTDEANNNGDAAALAALYTEDAFF
jgi:hypothetical protein